VSSNVTGQFDPIPWAVGQNADLAPGDPVPEGTIFSFQLNPSLPGVESYLRDGLAAGRLWFSLTSLHPATQQAGEFVSYYTKDDFVHQFSMANNPEYQGGIAPTLQLEVDLDVPLSIQRTADTVSLSWPEFPGFVFELQASPDLSPGSWQPVHSHAATTTGTGVHHEPLGPGARFYRLAITPTP
jgi:hypothetical protein